MINLAEFLRGNWAWLLVAVVWSVIWGGFALWRAAKLSQKWWFVVFLVVHTLGILEILYIFIFSRPAMRRQGLLKSKEEKVNA